MSDTPDTLAARSPIAALRRFSRRRAAPEEKCDLCSLGLMPEHQHLIDPVTRQIQCACDACAILFSDGSGKYRRVPQRCEWWTDFAITDEQWEALGVPIALAFFFFSSPLEHLVSMYPSPGGATEAVLPGEVWEILCQDNPRLGKLQPDVEALLVNRLGGVREYFRVPIDQCFKLVGLIRVHWRGLSGGPVLWQQIAAFFAELRAKSNKVTAHA
jgi:hypothetical protein